MGRAGVRLGVAVLVTVIACGTAWYWLVEGFTFIDGLYQTITTVSTVGFREIQPLDTSGRIFTIGVILFGVGAMLFTVTSFFEEMLEDQVGRIGRRRMERTIGRMRGHMVVCGYGRVGRMVAALIADTNDVVVIDNDPEKVRSATEAGLVVIEGDATDDGVLNGAGLDRAAILVSALPTDADNVFVVLSGRSANSDLHIVARARQEPSEGKLLRAGADRVVNPQDIGARRMAAFALQPAVSDFLDVVMHGTGAVEYRMEQVRLPDDGPLLGSTIRDSHIRDHTGALVLALRHADGRFVTNPEPETRLEAGMTMIAIGTGEQLHRLHGFIHNGRST